MSDDRHPFTVQPGCNVCICGELRGHWWHGDDAEFDREVRALSEYNRLGPMVITPARLAALDEMWDTPSSDREPQSKD